MPGKPKGSPKTGGRTKGTLNKRTMVAQDKINQLLSENKSPLDFLIDAMLNESLEMAERIDAAKAAAPYIHPKLASIEVKGSSDAPLEMSWSLNLVKTAAQNWIERDTRNIKPQLLVDAGTETRIT